MRLLMQSSTSCNVVQSRAISQGGCLAGVGSPHGTPVTLPKRLRPRTLYGYRLQATREYSSAGLVDDEDVPVWTGLTEWRRHGVDERRLWGQSGAIEGGSRPDPDCLEPLADSLVECAIQVLSTACPRMKADITHRAWQAYNRGALPVGPPDDCIAAADNAGKLQLQLPPRPARPVKPELLPPRQVPGIGEAGALPAVAHALHTVTHIELNAIDLAWDTASRFWRLGLPPAFVVDFARVADDESRHLSWCLQRLRELGHEYGDMPAHDVLWQTCEASSQDIRARLALIPCGQEARGLDAGPRLVQRLMGHGDLRSAAIIRQISAEEKAHVAVGIAWLRLVSAALDEAPGESFRAWLSCLSPDLPRGPFDHAVRAEVGLPRSWYDPMSWPAHPLQPIHTTDPLEVAEAATAQDTTLGMDAEQSRNGLSIGRTRNLPKRGEAAQVLAARSRVAPPHLMPAQILQLQQRLSFWLGTEAGLA